MGYTKKLRFLIIFGVGVVFAGIMGAGMLTGAIAADVSLGAKRIVIEQDALRSGKGSLYGDVLNSPDSGSEPMVMVRLKDVTIDNVCILLPSGHIPGLGEFNIRIKSAQLKADFIHMKAQKVHADLSLTNIQIGSGFQHDNKDIRPDTFVAGADTFTIGSGKILARYLTAGQLSLKDQRVSIVRGEGHC